VALPRSDCAYRHLQAMGVYAICDNGECGALQSLVFFFALVQFACASLPSSYSSQLSDEVSNRGTMRDVNTELELESLFDQRGVLVDAKGQVSVYDSEAWDIRGFQTLLAQEHHSSAVKIVLQTAVAAIQQLHAQLRSIKAQLARLLSPQDRNYWTSQQQQCQGVRDALVENLKDVAPGRAIDCVFLRDMIVHLNSVLDHPLPVPAVASGRFGTYHALSVKKVRILVETAPWKCAFVLVQMLESEKENIEGAQKPVKYVRLGYDPRGEEPGYVDSFPINDADNYEPVFEMPADSYFWDYILEQQNWHLLGSLPLEKELFGDLIKDLGVLIHACRQQSFAMAFEAARSLKPILQSVFTRISGEDQGVAVNWDVVLQKSRLRNAVQNVDAIRAHGLRLGVWNLPKNHVAIIELEKALRRAQPRAGAPTHLQHEDHVRFYNFWKVFLERAHIFEPIKLKDMQNDRYTQQDYLERIGAEILTKSFIPSNDMVVHCWILDGIVRFCKALQNILEDISTRGEVQSHIVDRADGVLVRVYNAIKVLHGMMQWRAQHVWGTENPEIVEMVMPNLRTARDNFEKWMSDHFVNIVKPEDRGSHTVSCNMAAFMPALLFEPKKHVEGIPASQGAILRDVFAHMNQVRNMPRGIAAVAYQITELEESFKLAKNQDVRARIFNRVMQYAFVFSQWVALWRDNMHLLPLQDIANGRLGAGGDWDEKRIEVTMKKKSDVPWEHVAHDLYCEIVRQDHQHDYIWDIDRMAPLKVRLDIAARKPSPAMEALKNLTILIHMSYVLRDHELRANLTEDFAAFYKATMESYTLPFSV